MFFFFWFRSNNIHFIKMVAIEELVNLSDLMRQAAALLNDEDLDDANSSSNRRGSTFLNVVALGNTVLLLTFFLFN